jgi:hypothetical protein
MFGLFETPKPKSNHKKAKTAVKNGAAKKEAELKPTMRDVLSTINRMQKELDLLKLAITSGEIELPEETGDRVFDSALREIQSGPDIQRNESERVLEGVFDGQNMVGADGQMYDVPANYASKSKLVEGDILKLTINNLGAFIYKQIKPIERMRKVGLLEQDPQNLQFYVADEGKKWKLLTASVTYFKGEPGDEVVFLIPAEGVSRWAAVENIIKQ